MGLHQGREHLAAGLAGRHGSPRREARDLRQDVLRDRPEQVRAVLRRELGVGLLIGLEAGLPGLALAGQLELLGREGHAHCLGHVEVLRVLPLEGELGRGDLVGAERRAVAGRAAGLVRAAVGDRRPAADQARTIAGGARLGQRRRHRHRVVTVDALDMPAIRDEPRPDILGEAERGRTVDRDQVIVVEVDQLAEPEVPGEAGRLRGHALHQVAVAADAVGEVIDDLQARTVVGRRQEALRQRHADARREARAQRTRRHLDPDRVPVLRVTRRLRVPLTKAL